MRNNIHPGARAAKFAGSAAKCLVELCETTSTDLRTGE